MTIYDEINEQLEDRTIDAAAVLAIGQSSDFGTESMDFGGGMVLPRFGCYLLDDDGNKRAISRRDYEVLDRNIEAMNAAWRASRKA